jgi:hypothetical protein
VALSGHAPAGPALRLHWLAAAPLPDWAAACLRLLAGCDEVRCSPLSGLTAAAAPRGSPPPPADQAGVVLCLDPSLAWTAADPLPQLPHWHLGDADGRALPSHEPLLESVSRGAGIALTLWQADRPGAAWRPLRRLHLRAPSQYGLARPLLPPALARLLRQAAVDHRLGVAPAARNAQAGAPAGLPAAAPAGLPAAAPADTRPGLAPQRRSAVPGRRLAWLAWHLRGSARHWWGRQRARWLQEQWRIGVVNAPISRLLAPGYQPEVWWLDPPDRNGYWADPMAAGPGENRLYCEYFDERSGVGRVEQLELDAQCRVHQRRVVPLGGDLHASFPLTLQLDGRLLGLAETGARRECVLHEIDGNGHWQPLVTMLSDVAAADPALFFWDGRYWLAITNMDLGESDNLCLYHAEQLLGPWTAHANNPVKIDATSARMAGGFFWHGGRLYRPAQNCLDGYGASVVLLEVLRCTPTAYEEVVVRRLSPDPRGRCPDGMHTVSAWGQRTLIDGKRHGFSLSASWRKLRRRLFGRPGAAR